MKLTLQDTLSDFSGLPFSSHAWHTPDVSGKSHELGLYDALMAIKPPDVSPNAWLVKASLNRNFFGDLKRTNRANVASIEKLLDVIDVSWAQFDASRHAAPLEQPRSTGVRSPALPYSVVDLPRDLPVMGAAEAADFEVRSNGDVVLIQQQEMYPGDVVNWLRRPPSLAGRSDAYALYVVGESMVPRFRHGEAVLVSQKQPASIGDDVVVQLAEPDGEGNPEIVHVLIKQLVRRTADELRLRQHNPHIEFALPRSRVAHIHRVVPWGEVVGI
jgi:phage repressor protein C with HTH and peptisase S24 domain